MIREYGLTKNSKILDIGCGKGYLLYDFTKLLPGISVYGVDISTYAKENSKEEIKNQISIGNATNLPWKDNFFDLVISINTLHCLHSYELCEAIREMERVGKSNKYLCVESYRNEEEKANLLYWQVSCEAFNNVKGWEWWLKSFNYSGDYSFIFFE